jgi:hypothetical protein
MRTVLMAVAVMAAMAGGAQAQVNVVQGEDRVVYKPVTVLDIAGTDIGCRWTKPVIGLIPSRTPSKFPSMITYRASFGPELQKSVDQL